MAQTGYTPILIYSSSTAAAAPAAGSLTNSTLGSELAINITDGKLFYKDNANAIQVIGWKVVPTTAGGTGLTSYAQGDLLYYNSGTTLTALSKNTTATRYLSNTGTNNNPAWAQVNLTNGVTGTLPVGNGGTGTATAFTAGSVVFAGASGVYSQDNTNFFWDDSNNRLGILTATPAGSLDVAGQNSYFGDSTNGGRLYFRRGVDGSAVGRVGWISGSNVNFEIANDSGSGKIILQTNSASRVEIDNAGDTNIKTGNLVIGTSGKGIDFSATPGTGTSELFADYEEGTFNPTVIGSTTAGTVTYANQIGRYTKVGRLVTVEIYLNWSAGTGTGNLQFGGLPFTPSGSTYGAVACVPENIALTAANIMVPRILASSTTIEPLQTPTGGGGLNTVPYDGAGNIMMTVSYSV